MRDLRVFFINVFNSSRISDDKLRQFANAVLQRLIANNDNNQYDALIAGLTSAYNEYFGNITDEDTAYALQQSRTIAVDNIIKNFKSMVSQKSGIIKGTYGETSEEWQEFFPQGLTEFNRANKSNIMTLMTRMVNASTAHLADLGQPFVDIWTAFQQSYQTARNAQLQQIGLVKDEKTETADTRDDVELELMRILLTIALENIDNPVNGMKFFPQEIIRSRDSNEIEITGKVTDSGTNQPLANVLIAIAALGLSTVTNANGEFTLRVPGSEAGTLELSASLENYIDQSATIEAEAGEDIEQDFALVAE